MAPTDETALLLYQSTRHLRPDHRERFLDAYFTAPEDERISLEQFLEHQAAVAAIFGDAR